jgi:hypothetical protein
MKTKITRICIHQRGEKTLDVNIYRDNIATKNYSDITSATKRRLTTFSYNDKKYRIVAMYTALISIFIIPRE